MRSLLIGRDLYASDREGFLDLSARILPELTQLSTLYPAFSKWYGDKVVPGLLVGERTVLLRFVGRQLGGIAIVKNTISEKKLCCLRVLPDFEGSGLGIKLFQDAFEVLCTDKPLLSVAEEQMSRFSKIFSHFGFEIEGEYKELYRKSRTEYSFNGSLLLSNSEIKPKPTQMILEAA